ncbi:LrgB family protein [Paraglaciecola sp. MB-3u-78]|jgi:putative effector of murein hydrolase|uniref:LrgB family protein n=1 Tax=Paraglaciecola sp. MB-3u-78 TaxID=2058332 RepID=UPI000C3250C9|nr:LrgB family protein [Paraglaciecola sp. MB-3u-78]PKG96155.1 LrgB family protein [Paraglaciecola sp. MB-3u-78]
MLTFLNEINWLATLLWLMVTVIIYIGALHLYKITKPLWFIHPALHPLIVSTLLIILLQSWTHTSVSEYQDYTNLLSALLGPATVALAVPLYKQLNILMKMSWRVLVPISVAGVLSPALSWTCLYLLDTPLNLQMTMLVKSITTPLAMDAAGAIGGIPSLAAVFVISTGIVGAICGPALFALIGVHNQAAQGTALGAVSHAVGTARAISISEQCTAFASLALCVNGIATSLILPILFG